MTLTARDVDSKQTVSTAFFKVLRLSLSRTEATLYFWREWGGGVSYGFWRPLAAFPCFTFTYPLPRMLVLSPIIWLNIPTPCRTAFRPRSECCRNSPHRDQKQCTFLLARSSCCCPHRTAVRWTDTAPLGRLVTRRPNCWTRKRRRNNPVKYSDWLQNQHTAQYRCSWFILSHITVTNIGITNNGIQWQCRTPISAQHLINPYSANVDNMESSYQC
jgi:hypothetical protein